MRVSACCRTAVTTWNEVRDALADIVSDAERASAIIERVRGLAKRSAAEKVPLPLNGVVEDIVALAASESVVRRVTFARTSRRTFPSLPEIACSCSRCC
jgi:nitrogen-specific signal transduction histidine kinase